MPYFWQTVKLDGGPFIVDNSETNGNNGTEYFNGSAQCYTSTGL